MAKCKDSSRHAQALPSSGFSYRWTTTLIVIPSTLCLEVLDQIHAGHQRIHKCRQQAGQSVWWLGLSKQLEDLVKTCRVCCKYQSPKADPLIPSKLLKLPWQKVGTDLFEWNKSTYLLIVDYYSRYIEVAKLHSTSADEVIIHTKSIFARHKIPKQVIYCFMLNAAMTSHFTLNDSEYPMQPVCG